MTLVQLLDAYLAADDVLLTALRHNSVRDEYDYRAVARANALDALRKALTEADALAAEAPSSSLALASLHDDVRRRYAFPLTTPEPRR